MTQPIETELKLTATPAMLGELRAHPLLAGRETSGTLVTSYFDTLAGRLHQAGASLRIRSQGRRREQTLKLASPGGAAVRRQEFTAPLAGDLPELAGFPGEAVAELARLTGGQPLPLLGMTRITRGMRRIRYRESRIEVAFDTGSIAAGDRTQLVCEVELELLDGKLADVLALALKLPLGGELGWSVVSKAARCHALAFDRPLPAARAEPIALTPGMTITQGFRAIGWGCLNQLLANTPLIAGSGDPEAVHQGRVAIRRLRAGFSLFGESVADDAVVGFRAELGAAASVMGPLRDLDVIIARLEATADDHRDVEDQPFTTLARHLAQLRCAALEPVQAMLAGKAFQHLLLGFALWLEQSLGQSADPWLAASGHAAGDAPLGPFVAHVLARRHRRLKHARGKLGGMTDTELHKLRIAVKKLRYAAEFFVPLCMGKDARRDARAQAKVLGELQDKLGDIHDLAVEAAGREALFAGLDPLEAAALASQLDLRLGASHDSRGKVLKQAEQLLDREHAIAAWWHDAGKDK
jgi:triphosphatase